MPKEKPSELAQSIMDLVKLVDKSIQQAVAASNDAIAHTEDVKIQLGQIKQHIKELRKGNKNAEY
jgi:hypothetical protein